MKCPICSGELVQFEHKYEMAGKAIPYSSFRCGNCREELACGEQAEKVFREVADYKKELHCRKKLSYAGNSLVLRIPAKLAKSLNMRRGSTVDIIPEKQGFVVSAKA